MALIREMYLYDTYRLNDYLFHIGTLNFRILTASPKRMLDYTTLLKPYDSYIWMSIFISIFAVMFTMVAISHTSSTWIKNSARNSIHQCM